MRLVGAGSELLARAAPADELGCCCGRLGRVAARVTFLHHSLLALEPSMALASFSLSLLMQVHEAAAVGWRAAAMLASSGDPPPTPRVRQRASRDTWRGWLVHQVGVLRSWHPLPYRSATTPSRSPSTVCERRRAPHTCSPRQSGAARSCTPGGARQGLVVSHVLQSAAPTGPSP